MLLARHLVFQVVLVLIEYRLSEPRLLDVPLVHHVLEVDVVPAPAGEEPGLPTAPDLHDCLRRLILAHDGVRRVDVVVEFERIGGDGELDLACRAVPDVREEKHEDRSGVPVFVGLCRSCWGLVDL